MPELRPIKCIETDKKYESISAASRLTDIPVNSISRALKTGGKAYGFHFAYLTAKPVNPWEKSAPTVKKIICEETGEQYDNQQEIADVYGVSQQYVSQAISKHLPITHKHFRIEKVQSQKHLAYEAAWYDLYENCFQAWLSREKTIDFIAEHDLKISKSTVRTLFYKTCKEREIERPSRAGFKMKKSRVSDEETERRKNLYFRYINDEITIKQAARQLGVSVSSIYNIFNKFGGVR